MRFGIYLTCWLYLAVALLVAGSPAARASAVDFSTIAKQRSGAVVKVSASFSAKEKMKQKPLLRDWDALQDFFDIPRERLPQRDDQSYGSGFIISRDGYIVTNFHIVEGASSVDVILQDRSEFSASIVGSDVRSDLSLLKIKANDLPFVPVLDPKKVQLAVGEWVLAIGSPFGLDYSVSAGIVSAIGRHLPGYRNRQDYVPFVQTDVALNPGNSGGPLFNTRGQLVGVNSQIYTNSGGSIGLSFAIPLSVVRNVVDQLRANGLVQRGWLGVQIQTLTKDLADSFGMSRPQGALVAGVEPRSPADKAGLREGDVITVFNRQRIVSSGDLPPIVGLLKPGARVAVAFLRNGKRLERTVKIGTLKEAATPSQLDMQSADDFELSAWGLVVEDLDPNSAKSMGIVEGALVIKVLPGSPGDRAGVELGDVITLIADKPVRNARDYVRILSKLKRVVVVRMRAVRNGRPHYLALRRGN